MMTNGHKILIVDDNPINVELLQEILTGYDYLGVYSGEEAINVAQRFEPDLILLDIMMPKMDGYEVCKILRRDPRVKKAKIVMVSAKGMVSERIEAYQAGADDYITKPFDDEELMAKVQVYLRLKTREEVDLLKNELLRVLCMETVNPLSSVIWPLRELMDQLNQFHAEFKDNVQRSYSNALNLQQLFEKVVAMSSIRSGDLKLNLIIDDLAMVVRKAIVELTMRAEAKNIEIHMNLPEHALIRMDTMEVKRVIGSILDNAIRFSPQNGKVVVEISEADDNYFLSIMDRGEGISDEFAPKIFEAFSCLEESVDKNKWHGLSLPLAHLIVSKHNGTIKIESIPGSGTNITVIFPKAMISENDQADLITAFV